MYYVKVILIILACTPALFGQATKAELQGLVKNGEYIAAKDIVRQTVAANPQDIEVMLLAGDIYTELENNDSAIYFYKLAVEINDDHTPALRKLAVALAEKGQFKEAEKMAKDALDEDKKDIENYLAYAEVLIKQQKRADAEVQIGRAKKLNEKDPRTYIAFGDMYFNDAVYDLSKQSYEDALALDPNNIKAREKLAISYYWLANREVDKDLANEYFSLALSEYAKVSQADPKNARAFFEQGKILFWSKRYEDAAKLLYQYQKLRPDGALGRWMLAQSLYEVGYCDSAAPHLRYSAEKIDSVKDKANLLLARCYYDAKQYAKSAEEYKKIIGSVPPDVADYRRYATSVLFSGDTATSIALYKETVAKFPEEVCNLTVTVGKLMVSSKRYEDAVFFLNHRLSRPACSDSTDANTYYYLGLAYLFAKNADSAISQFNKSVALDSNYANAYLYLGDAYAMTGKPELADLMFNMTISKGSLNPDKNKQSINSAFGKLSGIVMEKKDWGGLLALTRRWLEINPESEFGWVYNAVAYQGNGNKAEACKSYSKVLEINPNNTTAQKNKSALGC